MKTPTKKTSLGIMILFIGIIIILLTVVWVIGLKQPKSSTSEAVPELVKAEVEIQLDQSVIVGLNSNSIAIIPGEVSMFIPSNAISQYGQITFTPKEADILSEAGDPGWKRPYVYNVEFKDENGTLIDVEVNQFVEICFMMDDVLWNDFLDRPETFQIHFYDESKSPIRWEALSMNTYIFRQQVCGETSHFSLFALAYQEPPTPTVEPSLTIESTETPEGVYVP